MINLIYIELKKIFHKKGIFVIFGIIILFCFLNNFLFWKDYDEEGHYKYENQDNLLEEENSLEEELKQYDILSPSDLTMYLSIKTKIDVLKIKEQYSPNSWQYQKANDYLYDLIYQVNYATNYNLEEIEVANIMKDYKEKLNKFETDDWKYFINIEKEKKDQEIKELKFNLEKTTDKKRIAELEESLSVMEDDLKILSYRLEKNIKEDTGFLNEALISYQEGLKLVKYYQNQEKTLSRKERIEYQNALSDVAINQYIIEHQTNINKQNNLNYQLRTIVEDYEIFIVIIILMITGTVLCEEFHSGTIKLLLIKPYSRVKILLSKYFTCICMVVFSIIFLILLQLLFGGIFFGKESLKIPVVVYHYGTKAIIEYSVFSYMMIRILAKLPFLIMLLTICFGISVVCTNTVIAIIIPLLLYMFSSSIHYLAVQYNLTFMRYFITMNWDFKDYLFGGITDFSEINLKFSVTIWLIYFIVILFLAFRLFQKKNIKNI